MVPPTDTLYWTLPDTCPSRVRPRLAFALTPPEAPEAGQSATCLAKVYDFDALNGAEPLLLVLIFCVIAVEHGRMTITIKQQEVGGRTADDTLPDSCDVTAYGFDLVLNSGGRVLDITSNRSSRILDIISHCGSRIFDVIADCGCSILVYWQLGRASPCTRRLLPPCRLACRQALASPTILVERSSHSHRAQETASVPSAQRIPVGIFGYKHTTVTLIHFAEVTLLGDPTVAATGSASVHLTPTVRYQVSMHSPLLLIKF